MINGIVILNYNSWDLTKNLIESILLYEDSLKIKIVVSNNGNRLGNIDEINWYRENNVDILNNDHNGGFSYGHNCGVNYLLSKFDVKFLTLLNSDIEFLCPTLARLNSGIENKNAFIIQPSIVDNYGLVLKDNFENELEVKQKYFKLWNKTKKYKMQKSDSEVESRKMISGCFWHFKVENSSKIMPLDENVFLYLEEFILLHKNPTESCFVDNEINALHIGGASTGKKSWILMFFILLSENYYFMKLRKENLFLYFPFFIFRFFQFIRSNLFKKYFFLKMYYIYSAVFKGRNLKWKDVVKSLQL